MDLSDWFKGFEKGIARLSSEQRAAFFSECSKNCVDGGVLSIYRKLYKDANGDMDVFFQMADELPGVKSEIAWWATVPWVPACRSTPWRIP